MAFGVWSIKLIIKHVQGVERDCIVKRRKLGWFDKEMYLHRIVNNIGRLRQLVVPEYERKTALAKCWQTYLNVQGMDDKNETRDKKRVEFHDVLDYSINRFGSDAVEPPIAEVRAHGRGYAVVNWKSIYVSKLKDTSLRGYYEPERAKRSGKKFEGGRPRLHVEKYSPLTKDWWSDTVRKELLLEGGAYGHMAHPFDDKDLTFKDLKKEVTHIVSPPTFTVL